MTAFLAPSPIQDTFFIPGTNTPASGAQIFFYVAGSSTKQTVFKNSAGTIAHTNPVVLDSGGNIPSGGLIWFTGGVLYKAVYAPFNDTDPPVAAYKTLDDLSGINDSGAATASEWIAGPTPTFVNANSFTVAGDQTATFTASRRLRFTVTAGTVYGVVTQSAFSSATTVQVAFDSGSLDSGLSAVSYGIISSVNPSIDADQVNRKATAVASATTTDIWGVAGNYVHITGTTTVSNFSTAPYAGAMRDLVFDGSITLTQNATTMSLPGARNVVTQAGDRATVRADTTTNMVLTQYLRVSGLDKAQAMIKFNGTGVISILRSLNVSNISDNGTANYTVNFPVGNFSSASYSSVGMTGVTAGTYILRLESAKTSTSCQVTVLDATFTASTDSEDVSMAFFG